ncbi:hypothetical protein BRC83_10260 [Halobacteriales archaeon QS_1_68_17]|nr:MAG: hypothetical protein BRC83_10260 [Halobacteriales archaeon QS_1_68_17]
MKTASIFSFRDLGTNVGQTLTYTAEGFHDRGVLGRVYPRGVVETDVPSSVVDPPVPFGRYPLSALWAINEYVYGFDHRTYSTLVLDYFSSRKVGSDEADVHYYEIPGLERSLRASLEQGHESVVVAGTELATASIRRRVREYERWGIDLGVPETERDLAERRKRTYEAADSVIALSHFAKESLEGVAAHKTDVISQGVDPDAFPPKDSYGGEGFTGLFVGSINLLKGIPYLLEGWEEAGLIGDPEAELVLCGSVKADVEWLLDETPVKDLRLPGWVDPLPYYHEADVFVFPSLTEGFAKVILEAMSTGTPVIVSENSGGADAITDGREGFVVPPYDASAVADALDHFRDNPGDIERMGREARATAEMYDWDRFVDGVVDTLGLG